MPRQVWTLAALLLVASLGRAAEPPDPPEPPVRLKKKEKPPQPPAPSRKPEPAKPSERKEPKKEAKGDEEPPGTPEQDPQAEAAETLARVAKNMRASEDRLAQKDAGEGTRQIQRNILQDLDSLINQTRRQQQQQQQQQQPQDQSNDPSNARGQSGRQNAQGQQPRNRPSLTRQPAPANQPREGQANNRPGAGGQGKREAVGKIADLYKDVWGHLPETLRQEMDQYSREQFMAKYSDLLKQYYATVAEKGHRKGK